MKKIKVIDLLNIIANGEKVPEKIKWGEHNLTWCIYEHKALDELDDPNLFKCAGGNMSRRLLNDEVEIIEDTPKEVQKIEKIDISKFPKRNNSLKKTALKVNEIIELLNNSVLLSEKEVDKFLDKVNGDK